MLYNVVKKTFTSGLIQYKFYSNPVKNGFAKNEIIKNNNEIDNNERSIESLVFSVRRSKNNIYDLVRCVNWDYFITLTLNKEYCDRYNYESACDIIKLFTLWCRRHNIIYVLIPEQHKDGAWHFHGVIYSKNKSIYDKMLVDSGIKSKDTIYNIKSFKKGFTTATKIKDTERISSYITKYLTKSFGVPKGKKRYWFSKSIQKPIEKAYLVSDNELEDFIQCQADYSKYLGKFKEVRFYELHKKA